MKLAGSFAWIDFSGLVLGFGLVLAAWCFGALVLGSDLNNPGVRFGR